MSKYENALNHYRALEKSLEQEPVNKELLEHTRVAIEAIEKQIPEEPVMDCVVSADNDDTVYDTWYCPNCHEKYRTEHDGHNYCLECGQAIDWRELK